MGNSLSRNNLTLPRRVWKYGSEPSGKEVLVLCDTISATA